MDKKIIILLTVAVLASGCGDDQERPGSVSIQEFSIADDTLNPRQSTKVTAEIKNFNQAPTQIKASNIGLFNTGELEVVEGSKSCTPQSIGSSRKGFSPQIICTWTVKAPGEDYIKGFSSKPLTVDLRVRYESTLENKNEIKLEFQEMKDIDRTSSFSRQVSNSDLDMGIEAENPVPTSTENVIDVEVSNAGSGAIKEEIELSYTPEDLFTGSCPDEKKLIQGRTEFSCPVMAGSTGVRNVFIATHYKYQRTKSIGIEVVNNQ